MIKIPFSVRGLKTVHIILEFSLLLHLIINKKNEKNFVQSHHLVSLKFPFYFNRKTRIWAYGSEVALKMQCGVS